MKYKMIVADCDDTILNGDLEYSEYFKQAVKDYIAIGGKFVIATGRMTSAVLPICRDLGLKDEVICYQGGVIADIETGNVMSTSFIPYKDAYEVGKYIEQKGLYYHIYKDDDFLVKEANDYSSMYSYFCNTQAVETGMDLSKYILQNKVETVKILIIDDPDNIRPLIKELYTKFGEILDFNTSKEWMVEVIPKTMNKGIAVSNLASKYDIEKSEIICIGDSLNDLPMIQYAGMGVCMENGDPYVKENADIIAPSNDNEGVAYIIRHYGIGEK